MVFPGVESAGFSVMKMLCIGFLEIKDGSVNAPVTVMMTVGC